MPPPSPGKTQPSGPTQRGRSLSRLRSTEQARGIACGDPQTLRRKVDVAPTQGEQLPHPRERDSRAHHPRQHATPCLIERVGQPRRRSAFRIPARGRAPALAPGRPQPLLDLAPVGQPVPGVPGRPAPALGTKHLPARGPDLGLSESHPHAHSSVAWDILGTYLTCAEGSGLREIPTLQRFCSAPARIRTWDPRIRNPMLYPAELRGRRADEGARPRRPPHARGPRILAWARAGRGQLRQA